MNARLSKLNPELHPWAVIQAGSSRVDIKLLCDTKHPQHYIIIMTKCNHASQLKTFFIYCATSNWAPYLFIFTFSNVGSKATIFWIPVWKQNRKILKELNAVQTPRSVLGDAVFLPHSAQWLDPGLSLIYLLTGYFSPFTFRNDLKQPCKICLLAQAGHLRLFGSLHPTCRTVLP